MGAFLKKVEAFETAEAKALPKGLIAPFKAKKPSPAKKKKKKDGGSPATAKPLTDPSQSNLAHLRRAIPQLEQFLSVADPFNVGDATWGKFFALAAPQILVTLLWDLGHVQSNKDRSQLLRYFKQRVKSA